MTATMFYFAGDLVKRSQVEHALMVSGGRSLGAAVVQAVMDAADQGDRQAIEAIEGYLPGAVAVPGLLLPWRGDGLWYAFDCGYGEVEHVICGA
jgi:hypothetical protein